MKTREQILIDALRFYANKANWTDYDNWPTCDEGRVVLDREGANGVGRIDMRTPGWTEAEKALKDAGVEAMQ